MTRTLIVIMTLFLLVYSHVFIYYWAFFPYNFIIWRVAFVAIALVVFYGTIGLASLVAYRNRG